MTPKPTDAKDPLEELKKLADEYAVGVMWDVPTILDAAIAAWQKERAERHNEVELLHTKIDEVNRLRAAIEIARDVFRRWGWADEADALDAALGGGA